MGKNRPKRVAHNAHKPCRSDDDAELDRTVARPHELVTRARTPDERWIDRLAEMVVGGLVSNAATSVDYSRGRLGDVDLTACLAALTGTSNRVRQGDLGDVESLL